MWVFDPQGIVGEDPAGWWNPLSIVTDEVRAETLADIFASASRDPGAFTPPTSSPPAYFEPAGQQLLANLRLAAALAGRSITQVYLWLSNPTDDEPISVLEEHDYTLLGSGAAGGRQRAREAARWRIRHGDADRVVSDQPARRCSGSHRTAGASSGRDAQRSLGRRRLRG